MQGSISFSPLMPETAADEASIIHKAHKHTHTHQPANQLQQQLYGGRADRAKCVCAVNDAPVSKKEGKL